MLVPILRKCFPQDLLRLYAVKVNKIKINTIDRLLYGEERFDTKEFIHLKSKQPFIHFHKVIDNISDYRIKEKLQQAVTLTDSEYILKCENTFLEPANGWGFRKNNMLNYYSLGTSRAKFIFKPSIFKLRRKKNLVVLNNAISIRDISDRAYFHLYNDVLSKIILLKRHGIDFSDVSFVISKRLHDKRFFREIVQQSTLLSSLKWYVQNDEFILCKHVYFCKTVGLDKEVYDALSDIMLDKTLPVSDKKVFLTRAKNRLRFLENNDEVLAVAQKFGFEIVDADNLSLAEQIELFRNTRYLVGIHGSGLTNIIYRKNHLLSLLEIFPPSRLPHHYAFLCEQYGFNYNAIIGAESRKKYSGAFILNIQTLEESITKMLVSDL